MTSSAIEVNIEAIPDIVVDLDPAPVLTDADADARVKEEALSTVRLLEIPRQEGSPCGFHLTRSKWDPYPWVSAVDPETPAEKSGLLVGDCVLEVNCEDVLGMRIAAVAKLLSEQEGPVTLLLWSSGLSTKRRPETLCDGPMPTTLQRLSASMAAILGAIECPVCLDTISPPALQCIHGHLVCSNCRQRSDRCPVCRERYGRARSLLADQVFNALTDAFELRVGADELPPGKIRERLFGASKKNKTLSVAKPQAMSHTHKFLARIMGKSCSAENLSSEPQADEQRNLSVSNEDFSRSTLRSKSLSTNEIFRPESPISIPRCPSARRLNWSGSNESARYLGYDLSGPDLGSRRPVSRATSMECLAEVGHQDCREITLHVPQGTPKEMRRYSEDDDAEFRCPYSESCSELVRGNDLTSHISKTHGPLILWNGVGEFCVPLTSIMTNAHLILLCRDRTFHLKIVISNASSSSCSSVGDILVWCWLQDGASINKEQYLLEVKLRNDNIIEDIERTGMKSMIGRDICARCPTYSLKDTSWQDIKESRRGIFFTEATILANFGNVNSVNLSAEILPVIE